MAAFESVTQREPSDRAGSGTPELLGEQTLLFRELDDSMRVFLEAAATRDARAMNEQVRRQSSVCSLLQKTQQDLLQEISAGPGGAIGQHRTAFNELLQAVTCVRSRAQVVGALLPRMWRSGSALLRVCVSGDELYVPAHAKRGEMD